MAIEKAESSKQASKRAKKDRAAVVAALRDEIDDHEQHYCTDTNTETEAHPSNTAGKKKRTRSKLSWLPPMDGKSLEVQFNEYGQAVGENSNKLSSYIGYLVRELVPITYGTWHDVDENIKERLWIALQQHFTIEKCHRKWVLMSMGKNWRTYKSDLSRRIRNLATSKDVRDNVASLKELKPREIKSDKEWEKFVKERCSQEFQTRSLHFQGLRGKQRKIHRTSRKGMARLRHEMMQENSKKVVSRVDVWIRAYSKKDESASSEEVNQSLEKIEEYRRSQSSEASYSNSDAINHVYGPERPGRVLAGGFGVTPSRMASDSIASSSVSTMRKEFKELREQYDELKRIVMKNQQCQQDGGEQMMEVSAKAPAENSTPMNMTSGGRCNSKNIENAACKLLDWGGTGDIVGEGTVASTNPSSLVHLVILGPDSWKIWVVVALKNIPLPCPTSEFQMLNDATGSTIAWPEKYIMLD